MTTPSFRHFIEVFDRHQVEFAVVGGVAAVLHGAPVTTFDLDTLIRNFRGQRAACAARS
jgi:hypothetical protein